MEVRNMTLVNVDDKLYLHVRRLVEQYNVDFPNIKNFIDRAVQKKIKIEMIRSKEAEIKRK